VGLADVDIRQGEGVLHAVLSGEIDLSTVTDLDGRIEAALDGTVGVLLLDLREVTFLDSSGLRMILGLDQRQRDVGGRLVLVRGPRRVSRVFELTGAEERLEIVEDPSQVGLP